MQSLSSTAATTAISTHRQHTQAPGYSYSHNGNHNHGSVPTRINARPSDFQPLAKPVQPASSQDFHLDVFFNPVWMSGPHVFSFTKNGTVVRQETYQIEPYPGYQASATSSPASSLSSSSTTHSPSFPSIPIRKASRRMNKHWKNVAISEQDDAEFAAMKAEAEMRVRAEAKGKLIGLVYTWPPKPPVACAACEVLAVSQRRAGVGAQLSVGTGTGMGTQEDAVPALSCGSSGESMSESESEVFPTVSGRRDAPRRKEAPLEGNVGIGKIPRTKEGEGKGAWTLFGAPRGVGESDDDGRLSPLTTVPSWAEDQLTVSLKVMLRMHEV